ncbi:SusC/RagA family TonB-linked outer membrane protein [Fulvivirga maritima]|uniref:SusC/RagA family TonB-linked outer membrane protein n=1 Tax=Fulvivirga maritima TaxID=2904247 RepID=UPI001F338F05|nr:SusC/RagA family TonB-linked outer membrane protein [Fulvivirga maritima]UII24876.1 SusC/RagA family TonB-linked outer membrane protein [Fulvivirga maritima]
MKIRHLVNVNGFTKYFFIGCLLSCFTTVFCFAYGKNIQQVKSVKEVSVELSFDDNTLVEVFNKLERATTFKFSYFSDIDVESRFTMKKKRVTVADILLKIALRNHVSFRQVNNNITVYKSEPSKGNVEVIIADRTIKGIITDDNGDPLPGVSIQIKGTTRGTISDVDGSYTITVPDNQTVLVFSFIGMHTQEMAVGNRNVIDISLKSATQSLDELVIVGYGSQKKETLTGSVASIQTRELVQSPVSNISNSLVGRMPGLIAMQSSGEPGYDQSTLKIRGISTLNGGSESDPLILVDGVPRNFNQIDPNEIETVTILKDASATAVFGVRGANGVVMITTKTGVAGKPQISYTSNFGFQTPTQLPEMLNSYEYAKLHNEASENMGQTPYFSQQDLDLYQSGEDPYFHPSIDWFDFVLKDFSFQQSHNFNVRGGTDKTKYFISLGYFDQNGAYDVEDIQDSFSANPRYKRYNLRSNFDIDFNDNFSGSVKLGGQFTDSNYPGYGAGEIFFRILNSNPIMNPGIIDGKLISGVEGLPSSSGNPVSAIVNNGYQNNFTSTLTANVSLEHKLNFITQGLKVRGMVAYDNYYTHNVRRNKAMDTYRIIKDPDEPTTPIFIFEGNEAPFSFSESYGRNRRVYSEYAIEYNRVFGDHTVSGLALYMQEKYTAPGQEYNVPRGYQGLVGRVTYNYKSKYLTEVNMGYNGSENFPEGSRFGFFPSFSVGWVLTEEGFMPDSDLLSFLKIRASYGEVGNDKIGGARFLYLPSVYYTNSGGYHFGDQEGGSYQYYNGAQEGRLGNSNVTWERAKKTDIGLESSFFGDKLVINADYFMERRDNILAYLGTVPLIVQADLPPYNIGKVENKGFEVEVNYNNHIGLFKYWVKSNYSFAKNEIKYMDEPDRAYEWLRRTGKSVGQYWGLESDGIYNTEEELENAPTSSYTSELQPGDIRYVDQNGDGVIDDYDAVPIGYSRLPQIVYGFSCGFEFKGWDFSILFQGAERTSTYIDQMAAWAFDTDWRNATTKHLERWTPERYAAGEKITYPRVQLSPTPGDHNYRASDYWLKDASYLRLKNAEIAYSFKPASFAKLGIERVRVFANGNNLITWSEMDTYDPEAPEGRGEFYPQMKVYNVGVNVQF